MSDWNDDFDGAAQRARRVQADRERRERAKRVKAAIAKQARGDEDRTIVRTWQRGDRVEALAMLVRVTCQRHNIRIEWISDARKSVAWPRGRMIRIAPVTDEFSGGIALHEIGHIIGGVSRLGELPDEIIAWRSAEKLSPDGLTSGMFKALRMGLGSHARADPDDIGAGIAHEMTLSLRWAERRQARMRFKDCERRQARIRREMETRR